MFWFRGQQKRHFSSSNNLPELWYTFINSFKPFETTIVVNEKIVALFYLDLPKCCICCVLTDNSRAQAKHTCKCLQNWGGFLHFQNTDTGFLSEERRMIAGNTRRRSAYSLLADRRPTRRILGYHTKHLALQNNVINYSLISKCTPLVP